MPLEKIDTINKDGKICEQELQQALKDGFFDEHGKEIGEKLEISITENKELAKSFVTSLRTLSTNLLYQDKIKERSEQNTELLQKLTDLIREDKKESVQEERFGFGPMINEPNGLLENIVGNYINEMVIQEQKELRLATLIQKIKEQKDAIITGKTGLITIAKEMKNEEALSEVIPYFLSTLTAKEYSRYLAMLKPEGATMLWISNGVKKDKNQNRQKSFLQQYIGTHIDAIADRYPGTKKESGPYVKKNQQYDAIIAKAGREGLFLQQEFIQIIKENHLWGADINLIAQIFQHVQQKEIIMSDLHIAMENHNSKYSTKKLGNTINPYGIKDYSIGSDNLSVAKSEANLIKSGYGSRRCQKVDEINDLYIQALKTIPINKRTIKPMQDGTRNAEIPFTGQLINIQHLGKNEKNAVILVDTFPEQIELGVANFGKAWGEKKRSVVGQQVGSLVGGTLAVGASAVLTEGTSLTQSALIFTAGSKVGGIMGTYTGSLSEGQSLSQAYETTKKTNFAMDDTGNVNWLKVGADSAFDFTSAFLTFGIAQKIPGFKTLFASSSANIFKQMGSKSLQFGFEELAIESLLIDMPMNAVQTSTYAFTGLSEGGAIVGQSALGNKTEQLTHESSGSLKGDIWGSLQAGMDALEQNVKTENFAQVVTSTIAYGGILYAGRKGVGKLHSNISDQGQQKLNTLYGEYQQGVQQLTTHLASGGITLQKQGDNVLLVDKNGSPVDPSEYESVGIGNYITQLASIGKRYVEQMRDIQEQLAQNPDASRLSQMIRKYQVTGVLYSMENSFGKKLLYVNKQLENPKLTEQEKTSLIIMKGELGKINDMLQDKNTSFYIEKSIELPSGFQIDVQTITKSGLEWRNSIDKLPALAEGDKVVEIHIHENANIKQGLEEVKQQLLVLGKDVKYVIGMSYLTSLGKRYGFDIIHDKKLLERSTLKNGVLEPFNKCFENFILYKQLKEDSNTIKEQMRNNGRNKNSLFLEFKDYVRNNGSMQDNHGNQINETSDKYLEMWLKFDMEDIGLMIAEPNVLINNQPDTNSGLGGEKQLLLTEFSPERALPENDILGKTIDQQSVQIDQNTNVVDIQKTVDQNFTTKKAQLEKDIKKENDVEKKENLVDALKSLEGAYEQFTGIINGEVTMDNYAGVRIIAKILGLKNIETEILPLTKKIITNELKANGKEVITETDINNYIKEQINIDSVISEIFDNDLAMEQPYRGPDAITQINQLLDIFPVNSSDLLSAKDVELLKTYASQHIQALKEGFNLSEQEVFDLVQKNIRKGIFQNIADKGLLSGSDHGILHIIQGDMLTAWNILDQITGINPETKVKLKAMVGQMIIDHDIGYNMNAFEKMIKKNEKTGDFDKGAFFSATKDHPAYSRIFVDAHTETYTQIFGADNVDIMKVAMLDHSDVSGTDFNSIINGVNNGDKVAIQQTLQKLISLADCAGVTHVDKLHVLFQKKNMLLLLGKFEFIKANFPTNSEVGQKLFQEVKQQMIEEIHFLENNGDIDKNTANYYRNAINKGMDTVDLKKGKNPNSFGLKFNFSSYIYSTEGFFVGPDNKSAQIKMSVDLAMFNTISNLYGNDVAMNNLDKIIGDYGSITHFTVETESGIKTIKPENKDTLKQEMQNVINNSQGGDKITIHTKAKDGSNIDFNLKINGESVNNDLYESLQNIEKKHKQINLSIKALLENLTSNTQESSDHLIRAIIKQDLTLGTQINNIMEDNVLTNDEKKQKINEIRGNNVSSIYDQDTNLRRNKSADIIEELPNESSDIINQIEKSKSNPKQLNKILNKLNNKSTVLLDQIKGTLKSSGSIKEKSKTILHVIEHIGIIHHTIHTVKKMYGNTNTIVQNIKAKDWYALTGTMIELTTTVGLGLSVVVPHLKHALHGDLTGLIPPNGTLTITVHAIELAASKIKNTLHLLQLQQQSHITFNELEQVDITNDNNNAIIENYKDTVKLLTKGVKLEQHENIMMEFINKFDMKLTSETSLYDIFEHVVDQMDKNPSMIDEYRAMIHKRSKQIQPKNIAHKQVYNSIKDIFNGDNLPDYDKNSVGIDDAHRNATLQTINIH